MEAKNYDNIPKEKFKFVDKSDLNHDTKFDTKPIGYFHDAFRRFCKNKGALVAAIVIAFLILFALITPLCTQYTVSYSDARYAFTLPKSKLFSNTSFWDGCSEKEDNKETFTKYYAMGQETGHYAVKKQKYETSDGRYFKYRLDSYHSIGCIFKNITDKEYQDIQKYQNETGVQVLYPTISYEVRSLRPGQDKDDANYYYKTEQKSGKTVTVYDDDGNVIPDYKFHALGEEKPDKYDSLRIAGDGENGIEYEYAQLKDIGWEVRINYYEYYIYDHSYVSKDGITEPSFLFGTTSDGKDILTCLASGARFSFLFAIAVAVVNMIVGAIYGAVAGYYGGKTDLIMERISDILSAIPFTIVITLLKLHMGGSSTMLILFIAFFLTGWIGMASTTRMQFYRFKNQEYVLAARTLGAKDRRLMWKHIFPNSLGTLVTSCALIIPSMIFSETSLSYLGIINLSSGNLSSVGTILAGGQPYLMTFPHIIVFPSVFLALLMLAFNLFGNGLRDAFNPSLRGSEG
ncbi:MAG: ABC transporter permease [Roseburia sp.]|nr:ABC transporter permease [Roseburia sp.]